MQTGIYKASWFTWKNERVTRIEGEVAIVSPCNVPSHQYQEACVRQGAACYPLHHFEGLEFIRPIS